MVSIGPRFCSASARAATRLSRRNRSPRFASKVRKERNRLSVFRHANFGRQINGLPPPSRPLARNVSGDLGIIACVALTKSLHDTGAVLHFAILAHFPLAFEPRDDKAETDNAAQHDLDIALGCIRDLPGPCFGLFLLPG